MSNLASVAVVDLSEVAADINKNHELALDGMAQAFDHAVKAGLLLIEAKKLFPHGGWLKWLKANVRFGVRHAQNYMKIASCPDEKRNAVAHLSMRKAIHALALQKVERESDSCESEPEPETEARGRWLNADGSLTKEPKPVEPGDVDGDEVVTVQGDLDDEPATSEAVVEEAERRRRGFIACVSQSLVAAEDAGHHVDWFMENAPETIDDEIIKAAAAAASPWLTSLEWLQQKRASTLPQDGRSEVAADDITSEPSDDFPEIPSILDRRKGAAQ
jgi:Protein of unknown function (DUF3102)